MSTFSPDGVNASAAQPVTSGDGNESGSCDVGFCQSSMLIEVGSVNPHEVGLESRVAGVSVLAIGWLDDGSLGFVPGPAPEAPCSKRASSWVALAGSPQTRIVADSTGAPALVPLI